MASGLHFLMIPHMCPGHLIPMLDMAKIIAQHSATVTIVITPRNAARFGAVVGRAIASGLPIQTLELPFPTSEAGLPDGCESIDDLPTFDLCLKFIHALSLLQHPLELAFPNLNPRPNCIISDKHLPWTTEIANKFKVPWVFFDGMSCFNQLCTHNLCVSKVHERVSDNEPFVLPGLPDRITMTKSQLPTFFNLGSRADVDEHKCATEKIRAAEVGAYGVVFNSFEELEKRYVDEYRKVKRGKVWCIGPVSLSNHHDLDKAQRGNKSAVEDHRSLGWLASHRPGSVVYACLGSLIRLTLAQFVQLSLGLEESGHPFVLVMKQGSRAEETEKWLADDGFEERVKGRGVLVREWAPQVLILSHPAVGAFLTHCGWNSTMEAVCAGVPMVTWPMFADQFFNERLVVDVLGTGVSVGVQRVVHLGQEDAAGVQVSKEDVCTAVKTVMNPGKDGQEPRRKRAKDLAEMAKKATEEGGSSPKNITSFIQDIALHTNKGVAD